MIARWIHKPPMWTVMMLLHQRRLIWPILLWIHSSRFHGIRHTPGASHYLNNDGVTLWWCCWTRLGTVYMGIGHWEVEEAPDERLSRTRFAAARNSFVNFDQTAENHTWTTQAGFISVVLIISQSTNGLATAK